MKPRQRSHLLSLLAVGAFAVSTLEVFAQEKPAPGPGETREKGVDVKDGDQVKVVPPKKPAETPKTLVRYTNFCVALDKAAQQPDRQKEKFTSGPISFWGHEPWIATLICAYITGNGGDTPPFGARTAAEGAATKKEEVQQEYESRRKFLAEVLDQFQAHGSAKWQKEKWSPLTESIPRDRLLVGTTLYKNLEVSADQPDKLSPVKTPRFVARSLEMPDSLLLGIVADDFWGPKKDRKTEEGGKPLGTGVQAWLEAGERFLLRAHALAMGGALVLETNVDAPAAYMGTVKIGPVMEETSKKFQDTYLLHNIPKSAAYKEYGIEVEEKKGGPEKPDPAKVRKDERFVELAIDRFEVPAKSDRGQDVPGLSLFVYHPLLGAEHGGSNPRAWFVQSLALVSTGLDPGGITLPMWTFRNRGPQALAFADRLFDETTRVPVETRFEASAVCVARIHYYAMNDAASTRKVLDHELNHFRGIRNAWSAATQALETSLQHLAQQLNTDLNLQDEKAFAFKREELLDVWKKDPSDPDLTAIPEGPLRPPGGSDDMVNRAFQLHTNRKVSYLRMRLTRRLPAESGAHTLVEMLKSKEQIDPLFQKAQEIVNKWKSVHWKDNSTNDFRNTFTSQFLLAALTLDQREGEIDENGNQTGRQDLDGVIEKFKTLLKNHPDGDPLKLVEKAGSP